VLLQHAIVCTRCWAAVALATSARNVPPSDARWQDAASLDLCCSIHGLLVQAARAHRSNVVRPLIAELPRLAPPYERVAICANVPASRESSVGARLGARRPRTSGSGASAAASIAACCSVALVDLP